MQELVIQRLGHRGDGVAEGPVFVPRALPGERVAGDLDGSRLTGVRILEPSSERVAAPCRHYKTCGGCQLQHASDGFVAAWKESLLREALAREGLEAPMRPIVTSPPQSRRRATFAARRTKTGAMAGFHGRASEVLTEVPECQVVTPALRAALPLAKALAIAGGSRKGSLSVACTDAREGLDVSVTGGKKPLDGPLRLALARVIHEAGNVARLTWDGEPVAMEQPPTVLLGGVPVRLPAGAFLQATEHGQAALEDAVLEAVGSAPLVADLFAGCGTFALALLRGAEVLAAESEPEMIDALQAAWAAAGGMRPMSAVQRDLFRDPLTPDELNRCAAVVMDPPRAGAAAQSAQLAQSTVPVIAYVSCDPGSFARDAAVLVKGGYQLDWVQPVDQFRWSAHLELAARFSRPA